MGIHSQTNQGLPKWVVPQKATSGLKGLKQGSLRIHFPLPFRGLCLAKEKNFSPLGFRLFGILYLFPFDNLNQSINSKILSTNFCATKIKMEKYQHPHAIINALNIR